MVNIKKNLYNIWGVGRMEYRKFLADSRNIVVAAMLMLAYQFITKPLLDHAEQMGERINYLEPYTALLNSNLMILVIPTVFLVLMSDFPRMDGNTLMVVMRVGKRNWFLGQIVYFLLSIITYNAVLLAGMILPVLGRGVMSNRWSSVVCEFSARFPEQAQSRGASSIPEQIYYHMSPSYAVVMGGFLLMLYLLLLTLILMLVSIAGKKRIGILIDFAVVGAGMGLCATSSIYRFIMPMANSLLGVHFSKYYKDMVFSVTGSLIYFAVLILAVFAICCVINKRRCFFMNQETD